MIKVRYIYSACIVVETPDVKILSDPWFTDGIYDGSWYQFPKLSDPVGKIGSVDFIYISHIHPDHYDPDFLRTYLQHNPNAKLIIADFKANHLARKLKADQFTFEIVRHMRFGETELVIIPNEQEPIDINDVDSAMVIKRRGHVVANLNDNTYNESQMRQINEFAAGPIQIALLPYTGAGPYPQTYYQDETELQIRATNKKARFLDNYRRLQAPLNPKVTIPFAGKYVLGGRLSSLNTHRGVADPVEVTYFDSTAVVLDDGGDAWIDTELLKPSRIRTEKYDPAALREYIEEIKDRPLIYETQFNGFNINDLPVERLLPKAYKNSLRYSKIYNSDYYFCFRLTSNWYVCNANRENPKDWFSTDVSQITPKSEIGIDRRYLFGLITCIYHWNNAEIGSQFMVNRVPDVYNRDAQHFLNFFHV